MNAAEIKRMRTESVLKELIPEALATLEDGFLKGLCVTDVECKKGRYDAFVYLDKTPFDEREQEYILAHLKRVTRHLQNHCMAAEGWYRCPNFHFKFDDRLEYQNHMDKLFDKISKDLDKNG
ncbi:MULTISPECIES: 30S ribosome-binding factor RbfA [Campylobacter]|uniref:Ribosome-binding factor A n=1 Tax=Campylobacter curvus (strain 525.92) TaxID=360105 RepID=A7GZZ2_CAMC5|nr:MULTISPECIES: 30S ribosome-binding factor RbfA [Campylobacter]EAT99576.1 ribosome-binding factor A [Campylobacter curvus 525.92]EJP76419.1 ribosome-binding factor A [Campylobacter sp. FOBRC14]MBN7288274.1 30S ribosome-binding factor RbfA [Campylobacter curvus]MDU6827031.1 30S ribosome-binding factor RbfA [Campylobacter sp.]QKF61739.1 ribosome-binding factor A [Campylobacter curvus]